MHPLLEKQVIKILGFIPAGTNGLSALLEEISNTYYQQHSKETHHPTEDPNELLEKNKELSRKVKELDQFAYIVSHDLKAPLRNISSIINWIEEDHGNALTGTMKEHFELIKSRISGMENLIDGILAYSRSGRQSKPEWFSTGQLIGEIIEMIDPEKKCSFCVAGNMPSFKGQKLLFGQVMSNLISNAYKYGGSNPEVEIGYIPLETGYQFYVKDNGPGIPAVYHQHIFEMFKVLNEDSNKGSGIGLAIVKKIVEENSGKIWVESAPGKGARFVFTWPVKQEIYHEQTINNHE